MKKLDVLKAIAKGALVFVPGGKAIEAGIDALANRDDNPDNDLDEVADAITQITMGGVATAEGLQGIDYVNDPVLAQLAANIKGDIKLALLVVNKPVPPV